MHPPDFNNLSDDRLLVLIKEGSQLAFHQVYHRYWEGLYASAINILKDKSLAEDVLHEVFVAIWTKREVLSIHNLRAYLFQAVRNNSLLKIRNKKFVELHKDLIAGLSVVPDAEQNLAYGDLRSRVERASKSLPKRCRTIFFMSRYEEYSIEEIATHFNVSRRTVENQIHIALKHVRNALGNVVSLVLLALSYFWQ